MVKIVDTFNGWEGNRYPDRLTAEKALWHQRKAFYAIPSNRDARFCRAIVPAQLTWRWNYCTNHFAWQD